MATRATSNLLSVRLRKNLGKDFSLDAQFEAGPGFTILFGASAAGKSTLLNCIAGLLQPDDGVLSIGSRTLFDDTHRINVPARDRSIGYLFQNLALFPHLTVEENIEYGLAKLAAPARHDRVMSLVTTLGISDRLNRRPSQLSGGERQRVALARTLATDPVLLLLDEPLTALDNPTKSALLNDLRAWNVSHQIPILYVTHSVPEAFALGERVLVIDRGRIIAHGTPQEVLAAPSQELIANLTGFENIFDAKVESVNKQQGTMHCHLGKSAVGLEVPLARYESGDFVRVAIRAGDIMIATAKPLGLSARNIFKAQLVSMRIEGTTAIANLSAGSDVYFEVHLTPSAGYELQLESGREVWLVIKTYSCHLVSRDAT
ncbi:MAG TPA: molybdenum ABC transporter ATP-binding protein [Candidatus Binataceae bacterium]|nr:molybdenum ABC transporter ATP-binding protein [Candidatus Binataceae bacterium]